MDYSTAALDSDSEVSQVPIHSQVEKIKKEIEKIKHPSLQQSDMNTHLLLRGISISKPRSRSPLGLPSDTPISVGN
ncbi:uncharacterized protein E6C27_scaffold149G00850 [Cucumis melo var. makuwa]|uniref:Uncharacterized protein LOC103504534 n=2 Tax=Cucumis melo TaxID=3656 RepID=A0A1S4E6T1_CUCME|nr:uncharacterized protein LOC103504534 [Cucumis melo]KAA0046371.1 uncharacterized protein E6C27_scaffold149G00850 [Cucumis melo var. makuwa]